MRETPGAGLRLAEPAHHVGSSPAASPYKRPVKTANWHVVANPKVPVCGCSWVIRTPLRGCLASSLVCAVAKGHLRCVDRQGQRQEFECRTALHREVSSGGLQPNPLTAGGLLSLSVTPDKLLKDTETLYITGSFLGGCGQIDLPIRIILCYGNPYLSSPLKIFFKQKNC